MAFMTFHSVGNVIIPTDELTPSFFRGVGLNHQPGMISMDTTEVTFGSQALQWDWENMGKSSMVDCHA